MPALPLLNRRAFLKGALAAALGSGLGARSLAETTACEVRRETIFLPRLPAGFDGLRVAFLADTHHGPLVSLDYLHEVVELANALQPDLIALGGDYIQRGTESLAPGAARPFVRDGIGVLGGLRAPHGVFAVMGNHDNWFDHRSEIKAALAKNGIRELTNTGVWLRAPAAPGSRGGARLRICGVDELSTGRPDAADLHRALGDASADDAVMLLQHNPDYAETLRDPRVSLLLAGHTHGGQVVLPLLGAPILPSQYGQKYRDGLVRAPATQVFVTRGVGTIFPPVRFRCPPEVALLTLRRGPAKV